MAMKHYLRILMACLLTAALGSAAQAQNLFRCGNTYQDQPCHADQKSKVVGDTGAAKPVATSKADPACARKGAQAQKIMWGREAGQTAEVQLAAAAGEPDRQLIADVYGRRGNSVEVRAAIEADCEAARERALRAAALIDAAAKLQAPDSPAPAATATPAAATTAPRRPDTAATADTQSAFSRKALCQTLARRVETLQERQRAGGGVAAMEALNRQRAETEEERRQAGC
jgi:hypothetical protein